MNVNVSKKISKSGQIFAIGDVHGCLDELKKLVEKLPLSADSKIVFLGDYIDRGADSSGVIDFIIELGQKYDVVALKGNHEAMFMDFLEHPESTGAALFILNGGGSTLASYSEDEGHFEVPPEHIKFLSKCLTYYESEEHFFVHAGLRNLPLAKVDKQKEETLLWIRDSFLESSYDWGKRIVHGHTPVNQVTIKSNRINLDTGCVYGGCLSSMNVIDGMIYQVPAETSTMPKVMKDARPQRVARRFAGAVEVFVIKNGQIYGFETLNYNEFGLLIREVTPTTEPFLKIGEEINGVIGANTLNQVKFTGTVVRTDPNSAVPLYGVRISVKKRI